MFDKLIFEDTFTKLDSTVWHRYHGTGGPGTDFTEWDVDHLVIQNGILNIVTFQDPQHGGAWTTGGVSLRGLNFKFGKVVVRFRADKAAGVKYCQLLWPQFGWPPEIDFAEERPSEAGLRALTTSTLHYSPQNLMIHKKVVADFTQWHEVGVEWTPGQLVYTLDGGPWATINAPEVPAEPMHLALQAAVYKKFVTADTPAKSNIQFDSVRIYQ